VRRYIISAWEVPVQASELSERFRGISAVAITPFTEDGSAVDVAGVEATVDFLVTEQVDVVVACGNTAEYYGLSESEARTVVEASATALAGRAPLVVGVGGAPETARRATEHAAESGADAVMVHHPANPYVTAEGLHAYYRTIAEVGLPVVPYVKAPVVTPEELVRIAAEPWVVAVKYAVNDLPAFAAAVAAAAGRAELVWVCGTAERWAPFFFAVGADGFTSGLVNVAGGPSRALLDALRSGDRQATLDAWSSILPFEQLRARKADGYNVSVVKEAVRQLGRPAGPVRPPASEVGQDERAEIGAFLRSAGLATVAVA
jgi:4-hydroxy-tetrahydrodipicolinate synthase